MTTILQVHLGDPYPLGLQEVLWDTGPGAYYMPTSAAYLDIAQGASYEVIADQGSATSTEAQTLR